MTVRLAALVALATVATLTPARAALPCAAAPGVNDKCESWTATTANGYGDVAVSATGDRAYAITTGYGLTVSAYDPKQGTVLWAAHPVTDLPTSGIALTVSPDGRAVYAIGTLSLRPNLNSNPFDYFLTMRVDAKTGRVVWATVYKGIGANKNAPTALAVSPHGDRVYVTGWSERPGPYQKLPRDWATVGYDARSGKQLWVTRYAGVAGGDNEPAGVAVSPHGDRVYVSGRSEHPTQSPTSIYDIATIAYTTRGSARWVQRTPGTPTGLVLRGDHVWVGGAKPTGGGVVAAYAGASGAPVATISLVTGPLAFTVSPDEKRAYVTGISTAAQEVATVSTLGMSVTALDVKTARQAWTTTYSPPGAGFSLPDGIEVDATGTRVYATGVTGPAFAVTYPVTVCFSSEGKQTWVARHDVRDPQATSGTTPWRIAVPRAGGRVFVAGAVTPAVGGSAGLLLAYGA